MSLKASPLHLSAQNQMNPLKPAVAKLKRLTAHRKSVLFFFGQSQIHSYRRVVVQGSSALTCLDYIRLDVWGGGLQNNTYKIVLTC